MCSCRTPSISRAPMPWPWRKTKSSAQLQESVVLSNTSKQEQKGLPRFHPTALKANASHTSSDQKIRGRSTVVSTGPQYLRSILNPSTQRLVLPTQIGNFIRGVGVAIWRCQDLLRSTLSLSALHHLEDCLVHSSFRRDPTFGVDAIENVLVDECANLVLVIFGKLLSVAVVHCIP